MQGKVEICGVNTAKLPVLKAAETRELLEKARGGDRAAREKLISGNLRLVLSVIQKFVGRGESMDDLFQVGCIGLIKAVDCFDLSQNVQFSTYGVPTVIEWRKAKRRLISMTRKQALALAIQVLSENGQNEAAEILHKLSGELPFFSWSEEAIRDAVEQFILEHGRVPTATDFKKRGLPPHTVIKKRFGVTLQEWLNRYYPVVKPTEEEIRVKATDAFVKDYLRIRPKSADAFNAGRTPKSHCWYTVAVYNHTRSWRKLLAKLELPVYNNVETPRVRTQFKVNIISDTDFRS